MADIIRKLPVVFLVVVLLFLVVVFQLCYSGGGRRRRERRRGSKRVDVMEGRRPANAYAGDECAGRRPGDVQGRARRQSQYAHLPSWEQPLPDDEYEAQRSTTFPLASGSTQQWDSTPVYGVPGSGSRQTFTELLESGDAQGERDGDVNLDFGLGSSTASLGSRTLLVNPADGEYDDCAVTAVASRRRGSTSSSAHTDRRPPPSASQGATTSAPRGRHRGPSPLSGGAGNRKPAADDGWEDGGSDGDGGYRDGREEWKEARQSLSRRGEETIRRGVSRMNVRDDYGDEEEDVDGGDEDGVKDATVADEEGSSNPAAGGRRGNAGRGGRGRSSGNGGRRGRGGGASGEGGSADADSEGGRNFWSVADMIALIGAKRDQDIFVQGLACATAKLKTAQWRWTDVSERLRKIGIDRTAKQCEKKYDNLLQQFKKVHTHMGESGKQDFFQLTPRERTEKGYHFTMDRAIYEELKGSTIKKHTIYPANVVDTGSSGGQHIPPAPGGGPESVGDGDAGLGEDAGDGEDGSAKGSTPRSSQSGGLGKRKNMRQQTFDALTDCMDRHGALIADTVESGNKRMCAIATRDSDTKELDVNVRKKHYENSHEVSKLMCSALFEIAKALRDHS